MNLCGLLPLIQDIPFYHELIVALLNSEGEERVSVLNTAKPYLLACLYHELHLPILVITPSSAKARQLYDELLFWCGDNSIIQLFAEPDALPYEHLSSDLTTIQQRLKTLFLLNRETRPLVVTSAYGLIPKTIPAADFASACSILRTRMRVELTQMLSGWLKMGYKWENAVEVPGAISRRGGIIDIYSPNSDLPARIELFGDDIESIRLFDPATQRSVEKISEIAIVPAREMLIERQANYKLNIERGVIPRRGQDSSLSALLDLSTLDAESKEKFEHEIASLLNGQWSDGLEFYAPLFNHGSLLDYLRQDSLVILDEPEFIRSEITRFDAQAEELRKRQIQRGELPQNFPRPYFNSSELMERLKGLRHLSLEEWGDESHCHSIGFTPLPDHGGCLSTFITEAKTRVKEEQRVIIVSQQASRLSELLEEQDIFSFPLKDLEQLSPPGSITLIQGSLSGGWGLNLEQPVALFTDAEVFGFIKKSRISHKRPVRRQEFLSELTPGDYVVHIDHGIARFSGMTKMSIEGREREYLILEYAEGDRLYVPSDQVDRVSRYIGSGGYIPALSRLGTQEWNRTKQRVKQAARNLAQELLEIYAAREITPGFTFFPDTSWQQELEASFPYVETPDQFEAVYEVKRDMERAKPMDRLICGDVGYGKTEVALRAAFKVVMDNMQVAILVPTTVLAQQHFDTFRERLTAFPVRVEMLSRFRSPKEQQEIIEGLKNGAIDICIGTHRLLQKDVSFKNLGLVIIDEEQRFGVVHKEKLKKLRKEVDVLTLSATPIPRTLHMSLTGIRDLSTMETPPEERLPIKSYVAPYDERLIREAILRELERGGQVFFVHNRVHNIPSIARMLMDLVPEARIAVAHGQMPEESLESVMLDFVNGEFDVLVCTTIIESGLDMPNVNTIIINDADKLGLTQLYQLRGRVGRGTACAYAYFLYSRGKHLTDAAIERLRTIAQATELGSGFRIAMKDLEIRGAGNLLGAEQSGYMGAIGFELYSQLLTEAVEELKAKSEGRPFIPRPQPPTIDLPIPAYITEEYIADLSARLALYQRLAKVSSTEQVEDIEHEFNDRFGEIPQPLRNLLYIVKIKALGAQADIQAILYERNQVVLKLNHRLGVAKIPLQQRFGDKLRIGTSQIRLDIKRAGENWQETLISVIESLISPARQSSKRNEF